VALCFGEFLREEVRGLVAVRFPPVAGPLYLAPGPRRDDEFHGYSRILAMSFERSSTLPASASAKLSSMA
jgi:hypothetical protein